MVEVVGIEIVHRHAIAPGADERVGVVAVLVEERRHGGEVLEGEVAAHDAFIADRIVRLADAREQHQAHIVELERTEDHQVRRLLHFTALGIDVGHAGGEVLLGIEVHPQHMGIVAQLEVRHLAQGRKNVHIGRCLGIHVAGVATAESAEIARPHLRAVRVGVRPGGIGRRQVVGVVAHFPGSLLEQLRRNGVLLRRQREVIGAVRSERVATFVAAHHLPLDRPGGAGGAKDFSAKSKYGSSSS